MAIEEKANIDTLLIAAEVLERDIVKSVRFQPKDHLFQRDSLVHNPQRRFSTTFSSLSSSDFSFQSSMETLPMTASERHTLTNDLVAPAKMSAGQYYASCANATPSASPEYSLTDLKTVFSSRQRNGGGLVSAGCLLPFSNTDSPDRWPVRGNRSPPHASAFSSVTTQASSSSSSTEAVSMLPLKQLRTALLGDRHGAKVHRAFSDVNPPWSHESMAHLAEASQMSASSLASPEKAVPRLPAKKRKFDWGSGSADGDRTNAKISLPCALPSRYLGGVNGDTQGTPVLQQPTSLIVDKPTQQLASGSGGGGGEARKSTGPFADTNAAPFYYPTSHIPPKQEPSPVKQRKLSYPDLSFTSDPSNLFSRSPSISPSRAPAPPPPPSSSSVLSAFSMRGDLSSRRSSLVVDVNSSSISGSNTSSYQARSSLPTRGDSFRPKGNFSSPPPPPPPPPPLNRYPSHHSEAGRRYSVFGAPSGLSLAARGDFEHAVAEPASGSTAYVARRHSSVLSTARYASSSVSDSSFRPPHEKRAYNQPQFPVKRVPIESSPLFESGGLAESRPLSAPDDKIPNFSAPHHRSSPVKAEPPAPNPSPRSPTRHSQPPSLMDHSPTGLRDRQRKLSHVPVLGAILSSPSANQHNPSYAAGDRKRSLDSLFAPTKPCSYGGAVLLTGNACCPPNEKSFSDGGFPLLLVSAPTSASAAEFAAATAVASGAPASSLIPVPVQIVPDSASASSTCPPVETSVTLVSKTTNDCDQRLVFPLLPGADGKMNGCALGFPVLVSSRPRQTNSPH